MQRKRHKLTFDFMSDHPTSSCIGSKDPHSVPVDEAREPISLHKSRCPVFDERGLEGPQLLFTLSTFRGMHTEIGLV